MPPQECRESKIEQRPLNIAIIFASGTGERMEHSFLVFRAIMESREREEYPDLQEEGPYVL